MGSCLNVALGLSPPQKLQPIHILDGFDCGKEALNAWLQDHALKNQNDGYTQVMVVVDGLNVVAFYALAMSSVQREHVPRRIKAHPAPKEIPCVLLGQFAVDTRWCGKGIGRGLLKDALIRAVRMADEIGTRAVVVNALDEGAGKFWAQMGFIALRNDSQTYFRSIQDIRATLAVAVDRSGQAA